MHNEKKRRGNKQHKKLHNRFLTLFSCAGKLSHQHHLTRAANVRGEGGAPPSSKPVPNRIEPLRTKAAKFGGKRNEKHIECPGPGASTPREGVCASGGNHGGWSGKWGAGGPHLPSFGRDAPITQHHFPSLPSPSRAFRTHLYIGVTPTAEWGVPVAHENSSFLPV